MRPTDAEQKRPLILLQHAPYDGSLTRAAVDVVMSFAVFSQQPCVVFCGASVLSLLPDQAPDAAGRKSLAKVLDSLPLYDVDEVFVDRNSLEYFGASLAPLPDFAHVVSSDDIRALRDAASHVVSL